MLMNYDHSSVARWWGYCSSLSLPCLLLQKAFLLRKIHKKLIKSYYAARTKKKNLETW